MPVGVVGQDNLSGVSALRNMMGNFGDHDARNSSHTEENSRRDQV